MNTPRRETAEEREQRLRLLEDDIGRALADSQRSGELQAAPSYGKPLNFGDGYDETPAELRMPMKVLKDAGVVPPEVETMQRIAALEARAAAATDATQAAALRREAGELRLALQLRLERLRTTGSL
ncbi:DnaJ family domain-containing protein [Rubrivivax rivuli]|uniref:DUF1992 domain-containing protein n=1 Tax=Rubrivivax rivuli TaxID=1862385 RepID=A0A437RSA1_9BURK|nr:DnaJ family domain-containing protein [Rubrivivax rivuli]RVU49622.1 DUF1992 domain-containing protein [Rubrivivax rivuli]